MKREYIGPAILVLSAVIGVYSWWGLNHLPDRSGNFLQDDSVDSSYELPDVRVTEPQKPALAAAPQSNVTQPEDKEPVSDVTVIENEDGSVVIERTWGEKKGTTEPNTANMGAGGGEIPVDENGTYNGDHQDKVQPEPAKPAETVKPEQPKTEESKPETPKTDGGSSTPKGGDTKVDENGTKWVYDVAFGWTIATGTQTEIPNTDAIPGTGETVGSM